MKTIDGFPNYTIDEEGQVRSVQRGKTFLVKGHPIKDGYVGVRLWRDGVRYRRKIHTLVLEAFVGPRPPGMECRHLDGNSRNNRLSNLRWGTPKENAADSVRHGTAFFTTERGRAVIREAVRRFITDPKYRLPPRITYDDATVAAIRAAVGAGERQLDVAKRFNVSHCHVNRIVNRKRRASVG